MLRGIGAPKVNLKEYTGRRYDPEEEAWLDHWEELGGTIYSGKDCGGRATEILTKGIQRLHADPLLFLLTDPEYFEFVTRTLNPP